MSRKDTHVKDNQVKWTIRLYNSSGALVDADSTPTVAIRKNGSSTADSVTVTKRASTTGIYDCVYDPAGEAEGDQFTIEESATISGTTYNISWEFVTVDPMRGTDNSLLSSTFTTMFSGITSLAQWLGLLAGKQTADVTALSEINATGAGSGTYDSTTDSQEAIRDNLSSGGGSSSITLPYYNVTNEGEGTTAKLKQYSGETKTQQIYVYQLSGTTIIPVDMTAKKNTLKFVVKDSNKKQILSVDGTSMTITGSDNNIVNIPVSSSYLLEKNANYDFSLRDTGDGGKIYAAGIFILRYAP